MRCDEIQRRKRVEAVQLVSCSASLVLSGYFMTIGSPKKLIEVTLLLEVINEGSEPKWGERTSRIAARPPMRNRASPTLVAACLVAALGACQGGTAEPESPPPLPSLQLEAMAPSVQAALRRAEARASGDPQGPDANGAFGMVLHAYGLRDESIACYRRATAFAPRDWRWPYYLGAVYAELGRYRDATLYFRTAVSLQPSSVAARVRLGDSMLRDGRAHESRTVFETAVELHPSSAASHYGLGRACDADGDSIGALRAYMRTVELAPDAGAVRYSLAILYERLGRRSDAARQMELVGKQNRLEPPISDPLMTALLGLRTDKHALLQEGLRIERAGSLAEAVRAYEKAVELDDSYTQPRINLVAAFGKLKRFEDAEGQYERALELAPDSAELHVNWGTVLTELNRLTEAAASFRRALEINPHAASTHADLGLVLDRSGKTAEATAHFRIALEKEPGHRSANFHLARHLIRESRVEEAIGYLLRTLEPVDDRTPTYLYGLSDAYLRLKRLDDAVIYLRRALELANEMGQSHLARDLERDLLAIQAAHSP